MSKRAQILESAAELFGAHSFSGTGMDDIAQHSGITKRTIYSYFSSKEELILAVLSEFEIRQRNRLMTGVKDCSPDPRERLLCLFDVCGKWFEERSFHGCLLMAAAMEFKDRNSRIRNFTKSAALRLRDCFRQLAVEANVNDVDTLALEWALLYEGATITAHLTGDSSSAKLAKSTAEQLLAGVIH